MNYHRKNEFLIDVMPYSENVYSIYDISLFFRHAFGKDRARYEERIAFTIKGKEKVVYIIDYSESLDYDKAKAIAIKYIVNDFTVYRLD